MRAGKTLQSKFRKIGCDTVITCTNILQPRLDCIHLIEKQCSEQLTTWQIKHYLDLTPRSFNFKRGRDYTFPHSMSQNDFSRKPNMIFLQTWKICVFLFNFSKYSRWKPHGQNIVFIFRSIYIFLWHQATKIKHTPPPKS